MDVKAIKKQKLSSVLSTDFQICRHCGVVDRDTGRIQYGHECSTCGRPGEGGLMYFDSSVHILINLIQAAFHTSAASDSERSIEPEAHNVSVVLFFCTLRELVLNWLIRHLCGAQNIPKPIYERLLADNNTHALRLRNLLPSLTGVKWNALIERETKISELDYSDLDQFIRKAVKARNRFMHEGSQWSIDRSLAEGCMDGIWPLLNLHVSLHNRYVHPLHVEPEQPLARDW